MYVYEKVDMRYDRWIDDRCQIDKRKKERVRERKMTEMMEPAIKISNGSLSTLLF